jgi:hypothetical protein
MYDHNDKKYIRLLLPYSCAEHVAAIHASKSYLLAHMNVVTPLDGMILTVKVPYRYRRVICEVTGKPIQSLRKGDVLEVDIEFKGVWNVGEYSGFSWLLKSSVYID